MLASHADNNGCDESRNHRLESSICSVHNFTKLDPGVFRPKPKMEKGDASTMKKLTLESSRVGEKPVHVALSKTRRVV